jgi:hypothetical protein
MKTSEWLQLLFEAMIEQYLDKEGHTFYSDLTIETVLKSISLKNKHIAYTFFNRIKGSIERDILSCKHPLENRKRPWNGREECNLCESYRYFHPFDDGGMFQSGEWEDWKVKV